MPTSKPSYYILRVCLCSADYAVEREFADVRVYQQRDLLPTICALVCLDVQISLESVRNRIYRTTTGWATGFYKLNDGRILSVSLTRQGITRRKTRRID